MKGASQGLAFTLGAVWATVKAAAEALGKLLPLRRVHEALPPAAQGAVLVASGSFQSLDLVHQGRGGAAIRRLNDGGSLLRLEGFQVTVGPDLWVVLSEDEEPRSGSQLRNSVHVQVGRLKGIRGDQNYALPAEARPERFRSIAIYCRAFNVIFSHARLQAPPRPGTSDQEG
ncbi:MAG: DM13 domain-containing protein [Chloroflexi bacterium]|nr:DM13 domain-containing protein [Chloroflexota bacterium]